MHSCVCTVDVVVVVSFFVLSAPLYPCRPSHLESSTGVGCRRVALPSRVSAGSFILGGAHAEHPGVFVFMSGPKRCGQFPVCFSRRGSVLLLQR